MFFLKRALTGIDLGNSVIKIAFGKHTGNKSFIFKAITFNLPEDYQIDEDFDFCIEAIRRVCKSSKIHLNNCVLVANENWYQSLVVTFPVMPKKDLKNAMLYEIKRQSNISIENISFDYYPNRTIGKEIEYYVFFSEKEKIKMIVDKFKKHDINLNFIDVKEMISLALYKNLYADDRTVKCFFDVGYLGAKLVFTKEDRLIFVRNTAYGVKHILDILKSSSESDNLTELFQFKGITDRKIEEILREYLSEIFYDIIRTVNFFSTTYRENNPSNIIFSGGIFAIPGMYEYFCQNLPYPCILNNVLDLVDYKDEGMRKVGFIFNYAVGAVLR